MQVAESSGITSLRRKYEVSLHCTASMHFMTELLAETVDNLIKLLAAHLPSIPRLMLHFVVRMSSNRQTDGWMD